MDGSTFSCSFRSNTCDEMSISTQQCMFLRSSLVPTSLGFAYRLNLLELMTQRLVWTLVAAVIVRSAPTQLDFLISMHTCESQSCQKRANFH